MAIGEWKSEREAAGYVAGLFDGEGCVAYSMRRGTRRDAVRTLQISNSEPAIIDGCLSALAVLGITANVYAVKPKTSRHRVVQRIHIDGRPNLERFAKLVPFCSMEKRYKLEHALSTYHNHYRRIAAIRDDLERMWVDEALSVDEIAAHFECASGSVYRWLRKADIPLRSESHSQRATRRHGDRKR